MKITARLAMIDLSPEEEQQLEADFETMTAFGQRLARLDPDDPAQEPSGKESP